MFPALASRFFTTIDNWEAQEYSLGRDLGIRTCRRKQEVDKRESRAVIQGPMTISAKPTGDTEARTALQNCPKSGQSGQPLSPLSLIGRPGL